MTWLRLFERPTEEGKKKRVQWYKGLREHYINGIGNPDGQDYWLGMRYLAQVYQHQPFLRLRVELLTHTYKVWTAELAGVRFMKKGFQEGEVIRAYYTFEYSTFSSTCKYQ